MTLGGTLDAVMANLLTIWLVYGLWRWQKDERDFGAALHTTAPILIVTGLAAIDWLGRG